MCSRTFLSAFFFLFRFLPQRVVRATMVFCNLDEECFGVPACFYDSGLALWFAGARQLAFQKVDGNGPPFWICRRATAALASWAMVYGY